MTYQDKYFRTWTGPFPFDVTNVLSRAPLRAGVYQILYLREVVYIGVSATSLADRLSKHVRGHGNWAAARRGGAAGYEFVYFLCDGGTAKQIESHVLCVEKPPFNVKTEYRNYIDNIYVH